MRVEIDPDDVVKKTTDSRGRVTLGTEYANQGLEIAILNHDE